MSLGGEVSLGGVKQGGGAVQQVFQEMRRGATPPKVLQLFFRFDDCPLPPSVSSQSPADKEVRRCSQFEEIPFSPPAWLLAVFVCGKCQRSTVWS